MKLATIALASAIALSGTAAFAQTGYRSDVKAHHRTVDSMRRQPPIDYGNPNGDPGGPTTLSGTGSSEFGGSLPGATGYN
jgi:hypothetical protein